MDGGWRRVANTGDFEDEYPIRAIVDDKEYALCRVEDDVFALGNICTHAFARLSDGWCEGYQIFCPLHSGSFDVQTGNAVAAPCVDPIETYPVKIVGDEVFIDVNAGRLPR